MAKFYNYCAALRILEQDGGSWRFRHQIIHDYFMAMHKSNVRSKELQTKSIELS